LNLALFIGKRIAINKQQSFSKFIIRLSIAATSLSVMAMIITISFVNGFQKTVAQKVFSFWGHIRVQHFEVNKSLVSEETPIEKNDTVFHFLSKQPEIIQVQTFATKSAVIEKNKEIEGILFKGIEKNYDSTSIKNMMVSGRWLRFNDSLYSKEIIISSTIADELKIKLNDTVRVIFVSQEAGVSAYRPLLVVGIYKTGIEEYDKLFAIGDLQLIRRLSGWSDNQIGGYEVFLKDYKQMDLVNERLELPDVWSSKTIKQVYPSIFDWLGIQNVNRDVIFIVMAIVAVINLITCLLILVLERTNMIGILKAVGSEDNMIQTIFLYYAGIITVIGIGIGLFFGVGLSLLQQYTGFIKLDESNYYLSVAPIEIIWWQVLLISICTAIVCFLSLIIPTLMIKRIKPVKAIQFR
jgi:lipoprotein-releasing system permease protein